MLTNADITVYNEYYDKENRQEMYRRTVIYGVWFYAKNQVSLTVDGMKGANSYTVRIPVTANQDGSRYVPAHAYTGEEGTWTLKNGDYVALGALDQEIVRPAQLYSEADQVFRITSWSDNRFGGLQHWRVGGV